MKKSNEKKLSLSTETLVLLTPEHLDSVVGGLGDVQVNAKTCLWGSCQTVKVAR